jgi:hypothetical protein
MHTSPKITAVSSVSMAMRMASLSAVNRFILLVSISAACDESMRGRGRGRARGRPIREAARAACLAELHMQRFNRFNW